MDFIIYCDDLQEGLWFKNLNQAFKESAIHILPTVKKEVFKENMQHILKYDRPDIVLKHKKDIILVVERTIEVPSGHNVGQRFGRLVAAAEERIPAVYFGPYAAFKHGGATAGPRYMNLRLFHALEFMSLFHNAAITTINWPVDKDYEIIKHPIKDIKIKEYLNLFLSHYYENGLANINEAIINSEFQQEQRNEQARFTKSEIKNPEQYDNPPGSVEIIDRHNFENRLPGFKHFTSFYDEFVLYTIGMTYMRSDPYAGMSALYRYLYINSTPTIKRALLLSFPHITVEAWKALNPERKDYRMFKRFSDGILFKDAFIEKHNL